ncbi:MAG: ABC transporter permease [Smithella sp.]
MTNSLIEVNPHAAHPTSPAALVRNLWHNRQLIVQMAKREVVGRYKGSLMGMAWSFFNPLLMLVIYTFVFSVVFKTRWGINVQEGKMDFAMMLFVGMIIHGLFAECVNRAPGLILSNVNYVKKVVFPLDILPWIAFGSALFHAVISLVVLIVAQLIFMGHIPFTALLFPVVMLPLVFATIGFAWFLSSLGVFMRDIGQITGIITTVLLFISGVFFPISSLPETYRIWMRLNPLAVIIEEGRNVLILGKLPDPVTWCIMMVVGLIIAWAGFAWFQKTRKGFADVL